MRKIDNISDTGLVLFVDESRKGGTDFGTESDCLAYAYKYQRGKCYAYTQTRRPEYDKGKTTGNTIRQNNYALGRANDLQTGVDSVVLGKGHKVAKNGSNAVLKGRNGYAENYGENVYSASEVKDRARYVEIHYVGTTSDDNVTELFIGGRNNNKFNPNPDYAICYFVEWYATALNAESGEIWTQQNYAAFRWVLGTLTRVGNHSPTTLRDSNLDYSVGIEERGNGYIEVSVEGEANHNVVWNVVLQITEVRIEENLSANLVQNSKFDLGAEQVNILNASPTLGWSNLTQFGADFTQQATGGFAYLENIPQNIIQGKKYRISCDIENFSGNNTTGISSFGRTASTGATFRSSNGNITIFTTSSNGSNFRHYGRRGNHSFHLRNYSVKQLNPNDYWELPSTNVLFREGYIELNVVNGAFVYAQQNISYKVGTKYKLKAVINGTAGKKIRFQDNANNTGGLGTFNALVTMTGADQTFEITFTANSNSQKIVFARSDTGNFTAQLKEISLQEISYGV